MFTQSPSETTDTQTNALTPSSISEKHELTDGGTLHIKTFDQLTTSELYNLLHVRSSVFIVEQNCVYQDIDYNDQTAIHLWITQNGKTVAICRICEHRKSHLHWARQGIRKGNFPSCHWRRQTFPQRLRYNQNRIAAHEAAFLWKVWLSSHVRTFHDGRVAAS